MFALARREAILPFASGQWQRNESCFEGDEDKIHLE